MPPDKPKPPIRKAKLPQGVPVANEASKDPRPFDVKTVEFLVALMGQHDLSEIDLREGNLRIRLCRGPHGATVVAAPAPVAAAVAAPSVAPPAGAAAPAKPDKKLVEIKSPTPGTFYSKPNPDSDPYVREGARVQANTVVCLIE